MMTNFQLLFPSSNLLKFKIPYMAGGGGGCSTFDAESKSAKILKKKTIGDISKNFNFSGKSMLVSKAGFEYKCVCGTTKM